MIGVDVRLFPIREYWWLYGAFLVFVFAVLAVDLGLLNRKAKEVSFKSALWWSVTWVGLSLLVNLGLLWFAGWRLPNDARLMAIPGFDPAANAQRVALEFLAGYVVEYALSIDNIFIFVIVFRYFATPPKYQHRILFYGIIGALVFRGLFISIGTYLVRYHWVLYVFGAFLILTGVKMMFTNDEPEVHPEKNPVIRLFQKLVPITPTIESPAFFVKQAGRVMATPLFVTLLFVEMTDILFAIDSVPAILGLTSEPLVVFTSNVCAILGLRSMYFMLSGAMGTFHLLNYGLALVLVFVGLKMVILDKLFGGKFPIGLSLGFIATVLAISIGASLLFPKKKEDAGAPGGPVA